MWCISAAYLISWMCVYLRGTRRAAPPRRTPAPVPLTFPGLPAPLDPQYDLPILPALPLLWCVRHYLSSSSGKTRSSWWEGRERRPRRKGSRLFRCKQTCSQPAPSCCSSLAQGEGGPPGKTGLEGGLGPLGSPGPRGMTTQGKGVRNQPPVRKFCDPMMHLSPLELVVLLCH